MRVMSHRVNTKQCLDPRAPCMVPKSPPAQVCSRAQSCAKRQPSRAGFPLLCAALNPEPFPPNVCKSLLHNTNHLLVS